ncbi:MAG: hypothetical protein ABW007_02065, partial [Chitinophagaceae bacterium]
MQNRLYENMREHVTYSGMLRPGAKKRLTSSIEHLVMRARPQFIYNPVGKYHEWFTLGFLTLTISETERQISGKEAHEKLLEPFLLHARRKWGIQMYVWKAELQDRAKYNKKRVKEGKEVVKQLHYHITWDKWVHKDELQAKWNSLQKEAGYLENFNRAYPKLRDNPPSIQIRKPEDTTRLAGYLIKEICKNIQNEQSVIGKVWDCSNNLKGNKYYTTLMDSDKYLYLNSLVAQKKCERVDIEHATIYKLINASAKTVLTKAERKEFEQAMWNGLNESAILAKHKKELIPQPLNVQKRKPEPAKQTSMQLRTR